MALVFDKEYLQTTLNVTRSHLVEIGRRNSDGSYAGVTGFGKTLTLSIRDSILPKETAFPAWICEKAGSSSGSRGHRDLLLRKHALSVCFGGSGFACAAI